MIRILVSLLLLMVAAAPAVAADHPNYTLSIEGSGQIEVEIDGTTFTISLPDVIGGGDTFTMIDAIQLDAAIWKIASGTSASPLTTKGALLQIFKTQRYTSIGTCANKGDPQCAAAVTIEVLGKGTTNDMQPVGLNVEADNEGTGASGEGRDTAAIYTVGRAAKGQATGLFAAGRIDVPGTLTDARAVAIELQAQNFGGAPCPIDDDGGGCMGLRIVSNTSGATTNYNGAGVALRSVGASSTAQYAFKYGFFCTNNAVETSCFEDASVAGTSYRIRGTHAYGIDMSQAVISTAAIQFASDGSGKVLWGNPTVTLSIDPSVPTIKPGTTNTGSVGTSSLQFSNVFATTYVSGGSAGVSCPSGINATTFRSVGGIVTAC